MKFTNNKKIALATIATTMMSTVANATTQTNVVSRGLAEWVSIIAEILTILCLVIFAMYMGRFFSVKTDKDSENDTKITPGLRNGMMTALVGMAFCQAAIVVAQLCF